jgi:hypothetical protein
MLNIHFHACNSLFAIFGYHKYFGNIAKQYHILSQNWQMRDNAASYAAGLGGSTATHSCTNSGIKYCQVMASFSGSK